MGRVRVRLTWDAWQSADVGLSDLVGAHWYQPPGAPRELLHAYVRASALGDLTVLNAATADPVHDELRVCILRCQTCPDAYHALSRQTLLRAQ
jgi:hypothetical protein